MSEIIFLNGKFMEISEAYIPISSPGFQYGWGIFETMRVFHKKIISLNAHLQRLRRSASLTALALPYRGQEIKKAIFETVEKNGLQDARVRLTLWKNNPDSGILITAKRYRPLPAQKYRRGFKTVVSPFRQSENYLLVRIKSTARILYEISLLYARQRGFDEAILLNQRGYLCEATRSNLFFVQANTLYSPALECGCLGGITRQIVIELAGKLRIPVYEGKFTPEDLLAAEEAFLTNSLMGIMPLAGLGKTLIGRKKCPKITQLLIKEYNCLLR